MNTELLVSIDATYTELAVAIVGRSVSRGWVYGHDTAHCQSATAVRHGALNDGAWQHSRGSCLTAAAPGRCSAQGCGSTRSGGFRAQPDPSTPRYSPLSDTLSRHPNKLRENLL